MYFSYMDKPTITKEFLWKLSKIPEAAFENYLIVSRREMGKKVLRPEMERIKKEYEKRNAKKNFNQFLFSLKERGYIRPIKGSSVHEGFELTTKGKQKALQGKMAMEKGEREQRKDGKMIMIMFDIPKEKEKVRYIFHDALRELEYKMLQKSVWVSDKEGKKEEKEKEYGLERYVNIFIIEKVNI